MALLCCAEKELLSCVHPRGSLLLLLSPDQYIMEMYKPRNPRTKKEGSVEGRKMYKFAKESQLDVRAGLKIGRLDSSIIPHQLMTD